MSTELQTLINKVLGNKKYQNSSLQTKVEVAGSLFDDKVASDQRFKDLSKTAGHNIEYKPELQETGFEDRNMTPQGQTKLDSIEVEDTELKNRIKTNFISKMVNPKDEDVLQASGVGAGIGRFVDKAAHTIAGDEKHKNKVFAKDYIDQQIKSIDDGTHTITAKDKQPVNFDDNLQTLVGQVDVDANKHTNHGYTVGQELPYVAAGGATAFIPKLGVSLLADTALTAALSASQHARDKKGLEEILHDAGLSGLINAGTFGAVRGAKHLMQPKKETGISKVIPLNGKQTSNDIDAVDLSNPESILNAVKPPDTPIKNKSTKELLDIVSGKQKSNSLEEMESQTGVTKAFAYKDEPVRVDTHQSEPLPHKDATVGNQSPQDSISNKQRFFKDTKIVDDAGEPKTVYHGTKADFDEFDLSQASNGNFGKGFYFGDDVKGVNKHYAVGDKANIMPVNLSIKKPFDVDNIEDAKIVYQEYLADKGQSLPNINKPFSLYKVVTHGNAGKEEFTKFVKAKGYDGIAGTSPGAGRQYVAFKPTQVKSIHNQGTYDSKDPHILHSSPTIGSSIVGGVIGASTDVDGDGEITIQDLLIGAGVGAALGSKPSRKLIKESSTKIYDMLTPKKSKPRSINELIEATLPPETRIQREQRRFQDKFNRVKQLQGIKAEGKTLLDDSNAYQAEELFHGRVATRMQNMDEKVIQPLIKRIALSKHSQDDLDTYLVARHAAERNAKMMEVSGRVNGSGMSNEKAAKLLEELDTPEMREMAKYVDTLNDARLLLMKREGLESDEFIKALKSSYKHYVPLKRVMDDGAQLGQLTGKGFDIKGKEFKRALGSDRQVESPLMHSIMNFQETLTRSEKNKVGKAFLNFTEEFPDKSLYTVENLQYRPRYDRDGEITMLDPQYKLKDNVMHVKVDGKIKQITIHDKALAEAFKNLNPVQMGGAMQVAHKAVRFIASVNTQYNPEFVYSNFMRDITTAMMNVPEEVKVSRLAMLSDIPASIKGITSKQFGKEGNEWSKLFREMEAEGGVTGWMEQYQSDNLQKKLYNSIERANGKQQIRDKFSKVLDYVDHINTAVENGVRLVAYKHGKKAGLSNPQAASLAKNLTVNFNRKGEAGAALNTAYMFYNASMQGSVRMAQALMKSKAAQIGASGLVGVGTTLHIYNMNTAGDKYKLIPQYEKDMNLIIMDPDGKGGYTKVPLPYGYNVFKVFGDVAGEAYTGDTGYNPIGRVAGAIANSFNPIGTDSSLLTTITPTLVKPMVELETNRNFMDSPIRPSDRAYGADNLADSHKYFKSVNPTIKSTAQLINEVTGGSRNVSGAIDVSPETIEHYIGFITGGLGRLVMNTQGLASNVIEGEETSVNKVPFKRKIKGEVHPRAEYFKARDILSRSGKSQISSQEKELFHRMMHSALLSKQIDFKQYQRLTKEFKRNQVAVDYSKRNNIQGELSEKDKYILKVLTSGVQ